VNKAGSNKQIDVDILQCKVDILRARNIIPPHDDTTQKNPTTQSDTRETAQSSHKDTGSIQIEEILVGKAAPESVSEKEEAKEPLEIPSFDLAEELMAEQRRITAIRRKAPGAKTGVQRLKPEVQPVEHIIEEPKQALSEQEKIITEIVAKDIEKLCQGDYSANDK
jgi:hypothetical protein